MQYVQNGWSLATADLRAQFLREQGFLVLKCDNRGSDRRARHPYAPLRDTAPVTRPRASPP